MAGSYSHIVQKDGNLRSGLAISNSLDSGGDVVETVEQMYGMIWYLAGTYTPDREKDVIEDARNNYKQGLKIAKEVNG